MNARAGFAANLNDWIALSDQTAPVTDAASDELLKAGLLVLELALPLEGAALLLDFHAEDGWPRTFAVFHDLAAGIVVMHRQGKSMARHLLPGPLPAGDGTGRLSFRFDAPARRWSLSFEVIGPNGAPGSARITSNGSNPLPIPMADLARLCRADDKTRRHPSVLWFGVTRGEAPPARAPWIGLRTPVKTARGVLPAGHLVPGDKIQTLDDGMIPLHAVHKFELPSRGSFAPVLLRAPYFGGREDLLVATDQLLALTGTEVEYLFGEDEVLVEAGHLVDGRTALRDQRRAVTASVSLDFGLPTLIAADGCTLLCPASPQLAAMTTLPRRRLKDFEVLTLMSLLGRHSQCRVA